MHEAFATAGQETYIKHKSNNFWKLEGVFQIKNVLLHLRDVRLDRGTSESVMGCDFPHGLGTPEPPYGNSLDRKEQSLDLSWAVCKPQAVGLKTCSFSRRSDFLHGGWHRGINVCRKTAGLHTVLSSCF